MSLIVYFWGVLADGDALRCVGTPRVLAPARTRPGLETYGCSSCWARCLLALDICPQLRTGPLTDPYAGAFRCSMERAGDILRLAPVTPDPGPVIPPLARVVNVLGAAGDMC